eukprot:UN00343
MSQIFIPCFFWFLDKTSSGINHHLFCFGHIFNQMFIEFFFFFEYSSLIFSQAKSSSIFTASAPSPRLTFINATSFIDGFGYSLNLNLFFQIIIIDLLFRIASFLLLIFSFLRSGF